MKWIGLTGGIASGKSTVSRLLRQRSYQVIDADVLAREVVEKGSPGLQSVVDVFGTEVLQPDGSLDRNQLARLVFGKTQKLAQLEALLHPLIKARLVFLKSELATQGVPLAFYDVPLLFEKNLESEFDAVVVVSCTEVQQKERLKKRSGLSDQEIQERLQAQISLVHKIKKSHFVIQNDQDEAHLQKEIENMIQFLKKLK